METNKNKDKKKKKLNTEEIRAKVSDLIFDPDNMQRLQEQYKTLEGKDMLGAFKDLLKFLLPSMQAVDVTQKVDQSTELEDKMKEINSYMQTLNDKPKFSEHPAYKKLGPINLN